MFSQFPKKTLFSKLISGIVAVSFILTSVPVRSYAALGTADKLSAPKADRKHAGKTEQIKTELELLTQERPETRLLREQVISPKILVLDNEITLLEGPMTGGHNTEHAMLNGADGGLFNHSEPRGRLEATISSLMGDLSLSWRNGASLSDIQNKYKDNLKILTNLPDKEIDETFSWVKKYLYGRPEDPAQAKEDLARSIVNKIINTQLKNVIAYSNNYTFKQTVFCVGETKSQRDTGRTRKILKQDLSEILSGITKEDAQKIRLRIAYEPRWAINQQPPVTPNPEKEIQPTHRFIKDTLAKVLTAELDVD